MARKTAAEREREEGRKRKLEHERENFTTKEDKIERGERLASWDATDEEKMLYAESIIPDGARRLSDADLTEFRGRFIAGWLCDSKGIHYGLCDGSNKFKGTLDIPGYSSCVCWEPTVDELVKLLKGTTLINEFTAISVLKKYLMDNVMEINMRFRQGLCILDLELNDRTYTSSQWGTEATVISDAAKWVKSVISEENQVVYKCCETCRSFNLEVGKQPDGIGWERSECEEGIISQCAEFDYTKVSCDEWGRIV